MTEKPKPTSTGTHGTELGLNVDEHVVAIAWSAQSDAISVAGADGGIFLINAESLARVQRIGRHVGGALCVHFLRDGRLLSGGQDGAVQIHDRSQNGPPATLPVPSKWVEHMSSSGDGKLLALSAGRRVHLYAVGSMDLVHEFAELPSAVSGRAFAPKGSLLAAACYGGVQLLALSAPYRTSALPWKGACVALAWRPDASVVAVGGQDASVQFWRLPKGGHAAMSGFATKVKDLAWNSSGRWLATGGSNSIALWDFKSGPEGKMPKTLDGHFDVICGLAWQRVGPMLASVSREGVLMFWQPERNVSPIKAYALKFLPTVLAWSPDDELLAIGGTGGEVVIIDTQGLNT